MVDLPAGCPDAECPGSRSALDGPSPSSLSSARRADASSWWLVPVWFYKCVPVQTVVLTDLLSPHSLVWMYNLLWLSCEFGCWRSKRSLCPLICNTILFAVCVFYVNFHKYKNIWKGSNQSSSAGDNRGRLSTIVSALIFYIVVRRKLKVFGCWCWSETLTRLQVLVWCTNSSALSSHPFCSGLLPVCVSQLPPPPALCHLSGFRFSQVHHDEDGWRRTLDDESLRAWPWLGCQRKVKGQLRQLSLIGRPRPAGERRDRRLKNRRLSVGWMEDGPRTDHVNC